jgi:hypothetical protein
MENPFKQSSTTKEQIADFYCQLGLVLDGIWFIEAEKRIGFEKAYEIDQAVWLVYPRKEAKRIRSFMGLNPLVPLNPIQLEQAINLSMFNQTVRYEITTISTSPLIMQFMVTKCKSYEGMVKMGRTPNQIHTICKGIETATLENFLSELIPGIKIECIWCPYEKQEGKPGLCGWKLIFP